jgi:hypothetical protein
MKKCGLEIGSVDLPKTNRLRALDSCIYAKTKIIKSYLLSILLLSKVCHLIVSAGADRC